MRFIFAFLLSLFISLNAAYAVATEVCDLLEHSTNHETTTDSAAEHPEHFAHHNHEHEQVTVPDIKNKNPDQNAPAAHADHSHPHPSFTSVLPGGILLHALSGNDPHFAAPTDPFSSVAPTRLERPPRSALV